MSSVDCNSPTELNPLTDKIKNLCQSADAMQKFIDDVFVFALKSKWNAHVAAIVCNAVGDITIGEAKFRTRLLQKLQGAYKGNNYHK